MSVKESTQKSGICNKCYHGDSWTGSHPGSHQKGKGKGKEDNSTKGKGDAPGPRLDSKPGYGWYSDDSSNQPGGYRGHYDYYHGKGDETIPRIYPTNPNRGWHSHN